MFVTSQKLTGGPEESHGESPSVQPTEHGTSKWRRFVWTGAYKGTTPSFARSEGGYRESSVRPTVLRAILKLRRRANHYIRMLDLMYVPVIVV